MPPWPFAHPVRGDSQPSNGRDYMTARTVLLTRYALSWLLSLHDLDEAVYTDILYDTCMELAEDRLAGSDVFDENMEEMEVRIVCCQTLRLAHRNARLIPSSGWMLSCSQSSRYHMLQ